MNIRTTHKCYGCKETFRTDEMINYASLTATTTHWYCSKCYAEKLARERFLSEVCRIFGVKAPGPQIWTERKRIINTYGYTDDTIIDCLNYIYEIEKIQKKKPTLFFVTPPMVEKMKQYKRKEQSKAMSLVQATKQEVCEHIVPIKENIKNKKTIYNPDEWLGD